MTNSGDPKKKKSPFDDFPSDFSDFFKNIQRFIEDMLNNADSSDFEKMFEEGGDVTKPFVWGFSFNKGPDGKPRFEQFGDMIKKMGFGDRSPDDEPGRIREPLADIIEEDSILRILIELPGVEKTGIDLASTETILKVRAKSDTRNYRKEISLPTTVIPESSKAKFNNGVLEVTLQKTKSDHSKKINIE